MRSLSKFARIGIVLAAVAGCGGTSGGMSQIGSCDIPPGVGNLNHTCADYQWSGTIDTSGWSMACTLSKGSWGSGCSHDAAVGGCRLSETAGAGVAYTITTWSYSPATTAAGAMSGCSSMHGAFVAP